MPRFPRPLPSACVSVSMLPVELLESRVRNQVRRSNMAAFFLWCILFIICWPLALLAIVLFPIVWLITLPFRILGIAVHGVFALLAAILFLPARILRGPRAI